MEFRKKKRKVFSRPIIYCTLFIAGAMLLSPIRSLHAYPHADIGNFPYHGAPLSAPNYCTDCHAGIYDYKSGSTPCDVCHYSDTTGIGSSSIKNIQTHSSVVIGSDKYGEWDASDFYTHSLPSVSPSCDTCHSMESYHEMERLVTGDWTGYSDPYYVDGQGYITINLANITVHDQDFGDRGSWAAKTGKPGRGLLVLLSRYPEQQESPAWPEGRYAIGYVADSTENTILVKAFNVNSIAYAWEYGWGYFALTYGQATPYDQNGTQQYGFKFDGPTTFAANDGLAGGDDSTPDGICQVCHTQTKHWRSDGSFANHFSGRNCVKCHSHENGFKAESSSNQRKNGSG